MRVFVTGVNGYIGALLAPYLLQRGMDVRGLDTGFYRDGWLYSDDRSLAASPMTLNKDLRRVEEADLRGCDAVVHLAELSNDPLGQNNPTVTHKINHAGSVLLAQTARKRRNGRPDDRDGRLGAMSENGSLRRGRPGYDQQGILDVAVAAFNQYGYDATSMGVLADRLGLSKSAIYHHFASKDEILDRALDTALAALEGVLEQPDATHGRAADRLDHVLRGAVHVLVEQLPYVTLLLRVRGNTEVERRALALRRTAARDAGSVSRSRTRRPGRSSAAARARPQ